MASFFLVMKFNSFEMLLLFFITHSKRVKYNYLK